MVFHDLQNMIKNKVSSLCVLVPVFALNISFTEFNFVTWLNESDVQDTVQLTDSVLAMYFSEIQVSAYLNNVSCSRMSLPFGNGTSDWKSGEYLTSLCFNTNLRILIGWFGAIVLRNIVDVYTEHCLSLLPR